MSTVALALVSFTLVGIGTTSGRRRLRVAGVALAIVAFASMWIGGPLDPAERIIVVCGGIVAVAVVRSATRRSSRG